MGRPRGSRNKCKKNSNLVIDSSTTTIKVDGRKVRIMTDEQKRKMQEGRAKAKLKAQEGMIEGQESKVERKVKNTDIVIIGYGIDKGDTIPYPIFNSEKSSYKGKIYKSAIEARKGV